MTDYEQWRFRTTLLSDLATVIAGSERDYSPEEIVARAKVITEAVIREAGKAPERQEKPVSPGPAPDDYAALVFSGVAKKLGDTLHESAACLNEAARKAGPS
ncbi:MAG: hypothetical protein E6G97_18135 [Alphaproteobacteria bacterium]|nr:MAG: hypothetical protein E6G97_18135 [Alphaproteobacteria bacterium]